MGAPTIASLEVAVPVGRTCLSASLRVPAGPLGLVVFAHGSGSSRFSPRNAWVARHLNAAGFATLLADLLTAEEEESERATGGLRFDIDLLSERLGALAGWSRGQPALHPLACGLFGASTGAAAALSTAAERPDTVAAIVSRGGRPDLAGRALDRVRAPTLLIVGGADHAVLPLNEAALLRLRCPKRIAIVAGATHLFEEPGALDAVARLATDWFRQHLTSKFPDLRQINGRPGRARQPRRDAAYPARRPDGENR